MATTVYMLMQTLWQGEAVRPGQEVEVDDKTAERWTKRGIASLEAPAPPVQAEMPDGGFPCQEADCKDRPPFKSASALRGHMTRDHGGYKAPADAEPPKDEAKGGTYDKMISRKDTEPIQKNP